MTRAGGVTTISSNPATRSRADNGLGPADRLGDPTGGLEHADACLVIGEDLLLCCRLDAQRANLGGLLDLADVHRIWLRSISAGKARNLTRAREAIQLGGPETQ